MNVEEIMLTMFCNYCEAWPGEPCLSDTGLPVPPHVARYNLAVQRGLLPLAKVDAE